MKFAIWANEACYVKHRRRCVDAHTPLRSREAYAAAQVQHSAACWEHHLHVLTNVQAAIGGLVNDLGRNRSNERVNAPTYANIAKVVDAWVKPVWHGTVG